MAAMNTNNMRRHGTKPVHPSMRIEVFIGKLPAGTTDIVLRELAEPYDPCTIRILTKHDKAGLLCGFLSFETSEQADAFITKFNGVTVFEGGEPLNVKIARGKRSKKLFIGGLAMNTTEAELRAICEQFGTVQDVNILKRDQHAPCGFISFDTVDMASECLEALHDKPNKDGSKNYVVRKADVYNKPNKKSKNKRAYNAAFGQNVSVGNARSPQMWTPPDSSECDMIMQQNAWEQNQVFDNQMQQQQQQQQPVFQQQHGLFVGYDSNSCMSGISGMSGFDANSCMSNISMPMMDTSMSNMMTPSTSPGSTQMSVFTLGDGRTSTTSVGSLHPTPIGTPMQTSPQMTPTLVPQQSFSEQSNGSPHQFANMIPMPAPAFAPMQFDMNTQQFTPLPPMQSVVFVQPQMVPMSNFNFAPMPQQGDFAAPPMMQQPVPPTA